MTTGYAVHPGPGAAAERDHSWGLGIEKSGSLRKSLAVLAGAACSPEGDYPQAARPRNLSSSRDPWAGAHCGSGGWNTTRKPVNPNTHEVQWDYLEWFISYSAPGSAQARRCVHLRHSRVPISAKKATLAVGLTQMVALDVLTNFSPRFAKWRCLLVTQE